MLELVSLRGAEGNDRNDFWSLFRCHKSGSLALTRAKKSLTSCKLVTTLKLDLELCISGKSLVRKFLTAGLHKDFF